MNENNNFEFLDILSIISFFAQIQNMADDDKQNKYIHSFIKNVNIEIAKLHKENDIIMEQNEKILTKLNSLIGVKNNGTYS